MSGGAPPPSQALREALADLRPVETRNPMRDWLLCAIVSIGAGAAFALLIGLRRDMSELSRGWVVAFAAWWALGFSGVLHLACVPQRGQVSSRARAAGALGLLFGVATVVLGMAFATSSPISSHAPPGIESFFRHGWPCYVIGMAAATVPVAIAFWYLRGTTPLRTRWLATGIGAAGGALGGLVLHVHCPIVTASHVGLVHGVVPLIAAGVAALAAGVLLRARG